MLQISGNNKREMKLLNDFFNSKVGYLYTVWSEISVIAQLLELKKKVSDEDIYNAIQRMKNKKYMIYDPEKDKYIHFGSTMEDYTKHQDQQRRINFLIRNQRWAEADMYTSAYASYYLLW